LLKVRLLKRALGKKKTPEWVDAKRSFTLVSGLFFGTFSLQLLPVTFAVDGKWTLAFKL
tara:strand:- start:476 stop:652 length:177 start_codon:yes stop_codon:yes gene_type:complete